MNDLKSYLHSIKLYIKSILVFRGSLPLFFIGLFFLYFTSFAGIWILLNRFTQIGDWTFNEIIFIFTSSLISYGIRNLIFFQFRLLGDMVKAGEIDRHLVRPINPIISIMGTRLEIGGLVHIILGGMIFYYYRDIVGIDWTLANIAWLLIILIAGAIVQGGITIIIGSMAFLL